jgi:transcriptional regulator with XRE-family HTH domain
LKTPRNIVGPVVRKLRVKKKLTQAQYVAKLNVAGWDLSRETFAKIECQMRWVADFEIIKLAKALDMDAPALIRHAIASERDATVRTGQTQPKNT